MAENSRLKQRLVGAAVLVGVGIIFLPLVLQSPDELGLAIDDDVIPAKPPGLSVKVIPLNVPERAESAVSSTESQPAANQEDLPSGPLPAPADASPGTAGSVSDTPPPADMSPALGTPVAWVVQVGSFSDNDNAQALRDKLLKRKYAAFVDEVAGPGGGKTFRVRVGPELLRSRADTVRDELEKHFKLKGIVVRHTVG